MIFETEALQYSDFHDKNNIIENESLFPGIINGYGVSAFLIKSLEKVKNNVRSETLKTTLDDYTREYLHNISEYHYQSFMNENSHTHSIEARSIYFTQYAKTAYYKVLKEEEYLNKLLSTLGQ